MYSGGPAILDKTAFYDNGAQGTDDLSGEGGGGIFSNNVIYLVNSTLTINNANNMALWCQN